MGCTKGTLSGCSGDVANGTAVEACAAYPLAGQFVGDIPVMGGSLGTVITDVDTARKMTCNPANTTDPYAAPGKCSGTSVVATIKQTGAAAAATSTSAACLGVSTDSLAVVLVSLAGVVAML